MIHTGRSGCTVHIMCPCSLSVSIIVPSCCLCLWFYPKPNKALSAQLSCIWMLLWANYELGLPHLWTFVDICGDIRHMATRWHYQSCRDCILLYSDVLCCMIMGSYGTYDLLVTAGNQHTTIVIPSAKPSRTNNALYCLHCLPIITFHAEDHHKLHIFSPWPLCSEQFPNNFTLIPWQIVVLQQYTNPDNTLNTSITIPKLSHWDLNIHTSNVMCHICITTSSKIHILPI